MPGFVSIKALGSLQYKHEIFLINFNIELDFFLLFLINTMFKVRLATVSLFLDSATGNCIIVPR